MKILVFYSHVLEFIWELGDVGEGGRLRCLHSKVDTTISCVCIHERRL